MNTPTRVMVLGFDAMDFELVSALAGSGELPILRGLLETKPSADLHGPFGFYTGAIWPTFWSGRGPASHGRTCHMHLVPGTYEFARTSPFEHIDAEPYWDALSDNGYRCLTIDVPHARPTNSSEEVQIGDWGSHDRRRGAWTIPLTLSDSMGSYPVHPDCGTYARAGRWDELREALLAGCSARTDLALGFLAHDEFDVVTIVYGESHCAGHQFWFLHDETSTNHDVRLRRRLGDPLNDVYRALDRQLGRLIESVPDALIYVILSHGMGPHNNADHLVPEILRRLDHSEESKLGSDFIARTRHRVKASLRPLIPYRYRRARYQRRFGEASDLDRHGAQRASSRFFQHVNNTTSGVRINLVGREPQGQVDPTEAKDLTAQLIDEFESLVDPNTGRRVVRQAVRTSDIYEGPYLNQLPDLLIDWDDSSLISQVSSPSVGVVAGKYASTRSGDHRLRGKLILAGPGSQGISLNGPIDIADIAPTITRHFGTTLEDIDGQPLAGLAEVRVG